MAYLFKGTVKFLCYAAVVLAILVAFIGIPKTAHLATTGATTLGASFGIVIGSIPDFANGIDTGQRVMDKPAKSAN